MVTIVSIIARSLYYGNKQDIGKEQSDGDENEGLGVGEGCDAEPRSAPE
jgi:hypothetical protein